MKVIRWILWDNPVGLWLAALALAMGIWIILRVLETVLARRFFRLDQADSDRLYGLIGTLVRATSSLVIAIAALYAGSRLLELPDEVNRWFSAVVIIAFIFQAALWGNQLILFALRRYQAGDLTADGDRMTTIRALGFLAKLVLAVVATLLALDNIPGVKITTLLASLGIGGIAVAIALQGILADLFASLSIILDKPFVIGDFIILDGYLGTVEQIGLKTTRIRSLTGEQIIFSNNDLLKSRIRNYKSMTERRVLFSIGVVYQTPYQKLARIPRMIRDSIAAQAHARFDRSHFQSFGESALLFESVYYVRAADYAIYMDIQQAINLDIVRKFQDEGIAMAFPTRTLHLHSAAQDPSRERTPTSGD